MVVMYTSMITATWHGDVVFVVLLSSRDFCVALLIRCDTVQMMHLITLGVLAEKDAESRAARLLSSVF